MMALTPISASLDRFFSSAEPPLPPSGDHPPMRAGDPLTFVTFESSWLQTVSQSAVSRVVAQSRRRSSALAVEYGAARHGLSGRR